MRLQRISSNCSLICGVRVDDRSAAARSRTVIDVNGAASEAAASVRREPAHPRSRCAAQAVGDAGVALSRAAGAAGLGSASSRSRCAVTPGRRGGLGHPQPVAVAQRRDRCAPVPEAECCAGRRATPSASSHDVERRALPRPGRGHALGVDDARPPGVDFPAPGAARRSRSATRRVAKEGRTGAAAEPRHAVRRQRGGGHGRRAPAIRRSSSAVETSCSPRPRGAGCGGGRS